MLATLLLIAVQAEVDPAAYLRAHRAADAALVAGRLEEARRSFELCLELDPQNAAAVYGLACVDARAGAREAALDGLERAATLGWAESELALWDEDLASLLGDARFEQVVVAFRELRPSVRVRRAEVGGKLGAVREAPIACIRDEHNAGSADCVAVDPAGTRVAVGFDDGELALLDARTGLDLLPRAQLGSSVWTLDLGPGGKRCAALCWDGKLHCWAPEEPESSWSVLALQLGDRDSGWPFGAFVEFDPCGERVLAIGADRCGVLYGVSGKLIRELECDLGDFFDARVAWSPGGEHFAGWSGDTVRFFDGATGEPTETELKTPSRVIGFEFAPEGGIVATGHDEGVVRLWRRAADGAMTFELLREIQGPRVFFFPPFEARELAFSPDGRRLAVAFGASVHVSVIDVESGSLAWTSDFQGGRMGEHVHLRWNPTGSRIWWAWSGGVLEMCEVEVEPRFAVTGLGLGLPPRVGGGIAVFADYNAVTALDAASGRVLWTRAALRRRGLLFHAPAGHFDCDFDDLYGLWLDRSGRGREGEPLGPLAHELFDPKRVRAARAGVELARVRLR